MRQLYLIATVATTVTVMILVAMTCASEAKPSSPESCYEAVNGAVSLLDGKMDDTALYRSTFAVVVNTCGPAAPASAQAAAPPDRARSDRTKCDDLATAMSDLIADDKMNSADFVKARAAFAQSCAPR